MVLEGDSLATVAAINQENPCFNRYCQVVDDIRTRLSSFPNFVIQHVSRGANSAAHTLAKLALTLPSDVVWMEECPLPIHSIVFNVIFV
jgi:hypothetical protein